MTLDYKALRDLHTASGRRKQGCFLAEGHHLAGEALRWGRVRLLAVEEGRESVCEEEIGLEGEKKIPVHVIPSSRMKGLSQTSSGQGVFCVVEYEHKDFSPDILPSSGLLCMLERVQDPGNVGTILRTLDALGAEGMILSADSADITNDKTLRASMGAVYRVPVWRTEDPLETLRNLRASGWDVFCGDLSGDDFYQAAKGGPRQVFLVGNEGAGVTKEAAALASGRVRLPMPGKAESLNAAVAASVCLYEMAREAGRFGSF